MSRVDELPPDQRAALSILLRQRKSYAEVAAMLGIPRQAVHDRAHAALAVLAPRQARGLDARQRTEIGDYLLGQQPGSGERLRTRTLLSSSEPAGTWARALVAELALLADSALPEVPAPPETNAAAPPPAQPRPYPLSEAAATPPVATGPTRPGPAQPSSSRLGGALVLAAIAAAIIVVLILVLSGGGGSHHTNTSAGSTTSKGSTTSAVNEGRIALTPPEPNSGSRATVEILSEGSKHAFYIQAEHLPITTDFFYAIWLYNSPTSALPLSKAPPVGKSHKLAGAALLPADAGNYREIIVTRETSTRPSHPGHIILHGPLTLNG